MIGICKSNRSDFLKIFEDIETFWDHVWLWRLNKWNSKDFFLGIHWQGGDSLLMVHTYQKAIISQPKLLCAKNSSGLGPQKVKIFIAKTLWTVFLMVLQNSWKLKKTSENLCFLQTHGSLLWILLMQIIKYNKVLFEGAPPVNVSRITRRKLFNL